LGCPDCGSSDLYYSVTDDREHEDYVHMYEICTHCGFRKAFVEYKDDDTGPVNWSGLEH